MLSEEWHVFVFQQWWLLQGYPRLTVEYDWYLKAATRFAAEFEYYGGFGEIDWAIIDQLMAVMPQPAPEKEA